MRFFFLANSPFFMELRDITLNTDCIYLYISINLKCNFRFIKHQKIWITPFYLNKTKIELNLCSFKFFCVLFVCSRSSWRRWVLQGPLRRQRISSWDNVVQSLLLPGPGARAQPSLLLQWFLHESREIGSTRLLQLVVFCIL